MEDTLYMDLMNYLNSTNRRYPEHFYEIQPMHKRNDAKTNFRRKASHYHSVEGVLMLGGREVLPRSRLPTILNAYRDNPTTGGHFG